MNKVGETPPEYGGWETNLEITCKVFNRKSGKWESPQLKPEERKEILGALDVIRKSGQISEALKQEEAVLELTGKRVFVQEPSKKRFKDLTPDPGLLRRDSSEVKNIRSTLSQVAKAVKSLHRRGQKTNVEIDEKLAKKEGGVVIKVRVVPTSEQLSNELDLWAKNESEQYNRIKSASDELKMEKRIRDLESKGFDFNLINSMTIKLDTLRNAEEGINEILSQAAKLAKEGKHQDAIEYYTENMPEAFGYYCDAYREWQPEQNLLGVYLRERDNPFWFVPRHHLRLEEAKSVFAFAEKVAPGQIKTAEALERIEYSTANLDQNQLFVDYSRNQFVQLTEKETQFQQKVEDAIDALDDLNLKLKGFSDTEIEQYKDALNEVAVQSRLMNQVIKNIDDNFKYGAVPEGIELYTSEIENHMPAYRKSLCVLQDLQRLAANRIQQSEVFQLNLDRLSVHEEHLKAVAEKQESLGITKGDGEFVIDIEPSLRILDIEKKIQKEATKFSHISTELNNMQNWGEKLLISLGVFVRAFQTRRGELEALMRKEGFSDLQTAVIFNHYVAAYEAYQEWYSSLQEATDMANRRKYKEALELLSEHITSKFPKIAESMRNASLHKDQYNNEKVQNVLRKFLGEGIYVKATGELEPAKKPPDHPDVVIGIALHIYKYVGHNSISMRAFLGIMEDEKLEVPKSFLEASEFLINQETAINISKAQQKDLFINLKGISQHPIYGNMWKEALREEGWSLKEVENFAAVYTEYTDLVQPLLEGERAYAMELDPEKKRALRYQLEQAGRSINSRLGKINVKFEQLGGFKRLSSLVTAAQIFEKKMGGLNFLQGQIQKEYAVLGEPFGELGTREKLSADIERTLYNLGTTERTAFREQFEAIRNLIKTFNLAEGIEKDARQLQTLIRDKRAFLGEFFIRHHFDIPWMNPFGRPLLTGPQANENKYKLILQDQRWSIKDVQNFNNWHEAYHSVMHPIRLAEGRLREDPESVLLQQEFKKIYASQIKKVNALDSEFQKKFGLQKVKDLENAKIIYLAQLERDIQKAESTLEGASGKRIKGWLEGHLNKLRSTYKALSSLNYVADIEELNDWKARIETTIQKKMSWEKGYLSSLEKRSFLTEALKKILTKDLFQSIEPVVNLFSSYQDALRKINALERKLEKNPLDVRIRMDLQKELEIHKEKLFKLNKKLDGLKNDIALLQEEIDLIKMSLETPNESLDESAPLFTEVLRVQESFARLSEKQKQTLVAECSRVNLHEAFNAKVGFMNYVYETHYARIG